MKTQNVKNGIGIYLIFLVVLSGLNSFALDSISQDSRIWTNSGLAVYRNPIGQESFHLPCVTEELREHYKKTHSEYQLDYKGNLFVPPSDEMWNYYQQHLLKSFYFDANLAEIRSLVVFGTRDDRYSEFPKKYGTLSRREITYPPSKSQEIEQRLQALNPDRVARKKALLRYDAKTKLRLYEKYEESGSRIEYAPALMMINQFIVSKSEFFRAYTSGSRGVRFDSNGKPTHYPKDHQFDSELRPANPDYVTDHEIYRMFSSPHCSFILKNAVFADGETEFKGNYPGKIWSSFASPKQGIKEKEKEDQVKIQNQSNSDRFPDSGVILPETK